MLVLSRKKNQKVFIGNDIVVTVFQLGNGQVRLGFDAPANVPIVREEVIERNCVKNETSQTDRSY